MTAPAIKLTVTQRERLKALTLEQRQVVTPGRVMLCKGRRVVGYCDIDELGNTKTIEAQATLICLSPADYADVVRWLA
jgi:hypothetical protein